jgi:hypothetical protein
VTYQPGGPERQPAADTGTGEADLAVSEEALIAGHLPGNAEPIGDQDRPVCTGQMGTSEAEPARDIRTGQADRADTTADQHRGPARRIGHVGTVGDMTSLEPQRVPDLSILKINQPSNASTSKPDSARMTRSQRERAA